MRNDRNNPNDWRFMPSYHNPAPDEDANNMANIVMAVLAIVGLVSIIIAIW